MLTKNQTKELLKVKNVKRGVPIVDLQVEDKIVSYKERPSYLTEQLDSILEYEKESMDRVIELMGKVK